MLIHQGHGHYSGNQSQNLRRELTVCTVTCLNVICDRFGISRAEGNAEQAAWPKCHLKSSEFLGTRSRLSQDWVGICVAEETGSKE